ncbi:MFS transporter [Streptomyces pseudovenezuelae]|uniref:MFS transporter n=1 Tax=Streptomyces pseudovenezuelae TaxID=67350 RepID=A0ABZ1X9I9_9ACTN
MTTLGTPARGAATGSGDRSRPRAVLPALCATQIVSWGIVYYAFPVLNPQITGATGWPTGETTAAFSLGLVVSALTGIRVGRILDRRGPRTVMTTGSVVGVVSLLIVATAPNVPVFITGWALAGLAMAATFYQPAFAALTRWWAPDHVRALTIVTLAGGLASTAFAPLTAALADHLSWRYTYLVLAGILAAVTVTVPALALRAPWANPPNRLGTHGHKRRCCRGRAQPTLPPARHCLHPVGLRDVRRGRRPRPPPAGTRVHHKPGRLGPRTTILIALGGLTTAAFAAAPGPYALLIAVSVVAGMVRGNLTLLQATAITDRWGATHYGRLSGLLAAPATTAAALAPFAGAALATPLGGYGPLFLLLATVSVAAALSAPWTGILRTSLRDSRKPSVKRRSVPVFRRTSR